MFVGLSIVFENSSCVCVLEHYSSDEAGLWPGMPLC